MSGERYSTPTGLGESGWSAPRASGALTARLAVPGSKSLTNRELILSAIADSPSTLHAPLHSDDSVRMVAALTALGIQIESVEGESPFGPDLIVTPPSGSGSVGASSSGLRGATVDCGQAGTVMRFIAGIAGLAEGDVTLTAHESALHRPMGAMITALRDVGVDVDDEGRWALPFQVRGHGHIRGGEVVIDASASSQFVSGMLLAAPRFDTGLHLIHSGSRLPSMPHIDMTIECLANRGVHVERPSPREWIVPPQPPRGKTVAIEPDLSNAAPFLAAAMVTGGSVTITGWPAHSTQPGVMLATILHEMGARVTRRGGALTVAAGRGIRGIEIDLSAASELTPTIVGLAAFAPEPTTITGVGHIRGHETDRIAALVGNLRALGGAAEELEDGLRILPQPLHGGVWQAFHDHRIATTGALIGLAVGGVVVDDIGTTAKTMPQFPELWTSMLEGNGAE
ncbi:MAG TPA: 3-phosphoshikimate 1-carboxyvinyltransferase [Microbacterium sp.]|jgi:3-phosphoshikimate 1-carboxyvinyltransferase|uniref:3-phosphoshikimate 1-carboxyvinyltransferase n=1 Tax=Microbacterium TaxID=33882 RepID=UPI000C63EE39|nr:MULTISPECIES: 3-phosphoshikimate 1-carboxyvinyltransferase [unclassified Microbacterium]MEC8762387.1 3-phosphoshikimate 1-carboxyvinyltransferase [Actinomycetota bacterium]MBU18956.1 3-phosphoshikimate 1-carboxyvinyltransferase [Microbacterium sp.]HAJ17194.1 3-phosphoshikimate 1-carboxyvinyltransferase [Microbacterium sp.]HAM13707.1 3-phosphoshikimate 1-carboxyvinyltransferase [Microbacterium sp.]HBS08889.1 3-phosphoshikimate 1-carboxyvinyltransferase [Microbacterium sp.]|tara:strand:+ start:1225 stop:2589 length:1365 start_codon:yes stop_codon:yes gene_type:complete